MGFCAEVVLICAFMLGSLASPAYAELNTVGKLILKLEKARIYLGESTTVTATLFAGTATIRNMRYPVLAAEGISIGEFAPPRQEEFLEEGIAQTRYQFIAKVTPRTSGVIRIGPARLMGEVSTPAVGAGGFFGETILQEVSFVSDPLDLTVLPLPATGRPSDFSGAIGRFTLKVSASPSTLQPGDPLTVTTLISGTGNLDKAACPDLHAPGFKGYPAQIRRSGSSLQCRQVIISETGGSAVQPRLRFTFFNVSTARYETLQSAVIPLANIKIKPVQAAVSATSQAIQSAPPPSSPGRSPFRMWYLVLIPLSAAGALITAHYKKNGRHVRLSPGRHDSAPDSLLFAACIRTAESALSRDDVELFFDSAFRALETAHLDLRTQNKPELDELMSICDAVRYGRYQPGRQEMEDILVRVKRVRIDAG